MPLNSYLKLIDRYTRQVPIKCGFTWWTPEIIINTANKHPFKWYKFDPCDKYPEGRKDKEIALRRRFDIIYAWNVKSKRFDLFDNPEDIKRYWPINEIFLKMPQKSSTYHCTGDNDLIIMDDPTFPLVDCAIDIPTTEMFI